MERLRLLLAASLLALAGPAAAAPGQAGAIFDFAAAGRSAGMGSAYTALADDASALYYNPAGLGLVKGKQIGLMRSTLYGGAAYDYIGYAQQGRFGGLGAQLVRLSVSGLEGRDTLNNPTGSFEYQEQGLSFGYGTRLFFQRRMAVGGSLKMLRRTLGPASNSLMGVDAGAQYQAPWLGERVRLGLSVQNALGYKMGDTADTLPLIMRFGTGVRVVHGLMLAAHFGSDGQFAFGTEYALGPAALRMGLRGQNPAFGVGVAFRRKYSLDVAFQNHAVLGLSNQVSLGWRFGAEGTETKAREGYKGVLAKAEAALDRRDYLGAVEAYRRAAAATLDERDAQRASQETRFRNLTQLVEALRLATNPEMAKALGAGGEQARVGLLAVKAYMDREERKSLLLAQAAMGTDPGQGAFTALLQTMAKLTLQKPAADETAPFAQMLEVKLQKAFDAFKARRYEEAAEQCREVLMLDPASPLAHERLGSAYFAMGLRAKAVLEWKESLRHKPDNSALRDFMKRIAEEAP